MEFDASMGNAIFVSHQWVGNQHPDPESKQLRVLQDALTHMLSNLHHIPVDGFTEVSGKTSGGRPNKSPLFLKRTCLGSLDDPRFMCLERDLCQRLISKRRHCSSAYKVQGRVSQEFLYVLEEMLRCNGIFGSI